MDEKVSVGLPVEINLKNSALMTTVQHMRRSKGPWSSSAAASLVCDSDALVLFMPATAFIESTNTMFTATEVQEIAGVEVVYAFREVLEAGQVCASRQQHLSKQVSTFEMRCAGAYIDTSQCTPHASLTFHRTSEYRLFLNCNHSMCFVHSEHDISLESLPDRDDHTAATATAWSRLLLMLLSASIVWIRSNDATASIDLLYHRMIAFARGDLKDDLSEPTIDRSDVMLNSRMVVLGGMACIARILVASGRWNDFEADGHLRSIRIEWWAAIFSLSHWIALASDYLIVRLFLWDKTYTGHTDDTVRNTHLHSYLHSIAHFAGMCIWRGDALAALGGSAAVVDVSCATMIAFTDTPIKAGSNNFDAVARLLVAVLLCLTAICRCWFSVSTSGVLLQHDHSFWGRLTALIGVIYWLVQTIAVATSLTDLFVTPLALHISRRSVGDCRWTALTILAFMITLAGPRISANAQGIATIYQTRNKE
jgi:hypothetical protein